MLRVSSLGLTRYNVTSRILSLPLRHNLSKEAHQAAAPGEPDNDSLLCDTIYQSDLSTPSFGMADTEESTTTKQTDTRTERPSRIPPLMLAVSAAAAVSSRHPKNKAAAASPAVFAPGSISSIPGLATSSETSGNHPLSFEALRNKDRPLDSSTDGLPQDRDSLQYILANTSLTSKAWGAYERLIALPSPPSGTLPIPYALLHRLARMLSSTRPRTRTLFLRMLSVLSVLRYTGGRIHHWEWNALIDMAGKGWRKTRVDDFQSSLDMYHDMVTGKSPGSRLKAKRDEPSVPVIGRAIPPDIYTHTTLVNIAGRTFNEAAFRHAMDSYEASNITPNRITHLALIRYFTRKNDMPSVRAALFKMREQGHHLDLDSLNACIWAYGGMGYIDVAALIYRVLRHSQSHRADVDDAVHRLAVMEGLEVPVNLRPNATTYYTLIQCYAYHGHLIQSLNVFMDMLSAEGQSAFLAGGPAPDSSGMDNSPTLPAFRAIFLGFARHGKRVRDLPPAGSLTQRLTSSAWTITNLEALFETFVKLPHNTKPSERTIYWILVAFDTLSDHAKPKLRKVWEKLEERFGGGWGGRLEHFKRRIYDGRKIN